MSKKIIVFPILVLALLACHKPTGTPQFVCYYYNSSVSIPASDDMPEMSSQIYRDIE